jgi:hypothetical protein
MVAIPMNMYRIETNEFSHGLNFFQKTVLKLKGRPGIKNETISSYIGLDSKLIGIVVSELTTKGLINEHGSLSDKGKEKLNEVDGLVINSGKKKIGYVLQYVNQPKLYQYYVNQLIPADLLQDGKNKHPKIITGTKGDGQDYMDMPFFLDDLYKARLTMSNPDERELLRLIENSNKKSIENSNDENKQKLSEQLAIRFLNEQPELTWICTYVYLQEREDKTFEPDWRVLDPFGYGDNVALKFFLNAPVNKNLLTSIENIFADAKTIGGKMLSNYQEQLNKLVEDKMLTDFSFGINSLDFNLQQYVQAIVKNYILQQHQNYQDLDSSLVFSLNIQNALENILKIDKENRPAAYQSMFSLFEPENKNVDHKGKYNSLISIYRQRLLSQNTQVPKRLLNTTGTMLSRGNSLLSYLVSFILTYNIDYKSPLFKILKDRIETIIEIAQLRNEKGHGQTSKEKSLSPLKSDEVEKYYTFIKSFMNDYILNR